MDGSVAVVLLNRGNDTATVTAHWTDLGLHYSQVYVIICAASIIQALSFSFLRGPGN